MRTSLGKTLDGLAGTKGLDELSADLAKVGVFPRELLSALCLRAAQRSPTNLYELVRGEAAKLEIPDSVSLYDAVSSLIYLWQNSEGQPPKEIVADLMDIGVISQAEIQPIEEILSVIAPYFRTADVAAAYKELGLQTLDDVTGTVDLRFRFHESVGDFENYKEPKIYATLPTVIVSLVLSDADDNQNVVAFQMDESDLAMMQRCINLLRQEVDIVRSARTKLAQETI